METTKYFETYHTTFNEWQSNYSFNIPQYSNILDINITDDKNLTVLIQANNNSQPLNKILNIELSKNSLTKWTNFNFLKTITITEAKIITKLDSFKIETTKTNWYIFINITPDTEEKRNITLNQLNINNE